MSGSLHRICHSYNFGRRLLAALVCLSIAFWTTAPAVSHTPKFLDTVQEQLDMLEDHGHSHGLEIDLLWAMHGHQHDMADHDHHSAVLIRPTNAPANLFCRDDWLIAPSDCGSERVYLLERPPRG